MFEGIAIYNLLRTHPAKVTVEVLGWAASAASIIAMAGDGLPVAATPAVLRNEAISKVERMFGGTLTFQR